MVDISTISLIASPTTLVILAGFVWWLYKSIRSWDDRLTNVERYSKRANHNTTTIIKSMIKRRLLDEKDLEGLELDGD